MVRSNYVGAERVALVRLLVSAGEKLSKELWAQFAAPIFVKLFDFNDRAVRIVLLQELPKFAQQTPADTAAQILAKFVCNHMTHVHDVVLVEWIH